MDHAAACYLNLDLLEEVGSHSSLLVSQIFEQAVQGRLHHAIEVGVEGLAELACLSLRLMQLLIFAEICDKGILIDRLWLLGPVGGKDEQTVALERVALHWLFNHGLS